MSGFKGFFIAIWHGIQHIFGADNLNALAHAAENVMKTAAGQIVLTVIENLNSATMTSTDKRNTAFSQIKAQFAAQGHVVADSMINLLIELGVQALKGKALLAAQADTPTPAESDPTASATSA